MTIAGHESRVREPAPALTTLAPPVVLGVAIFILAVNLRMGISSVGPVLPTVVHDLDTGLIYGSLLTTAPVVMMGLAAPVSSRLASSLGVERVIVAALLLIGVATLARLWTGSPLPLLLTAVALGGGIAAANTMLPAVVRTYFPQHPALMTGVYTVGINAGAGLAAFATPRLEPVLGSSWHGPLAVWVAPALIALVVWAGLAARIGTRTRTMAGKMPWASRRAWMITLFFGLQSMVYYGILAWLAPLYEERGWPKDRAGLLVSFLTGFQIVGAVSVSLQVHHTGRLAAACRATAAISCAALLLVAFTPLEAPWLLIAVLGIGVGGIFPLSLMMPLAATDNAEDARRWTAMMLCCGYVFAATGPFVVGALRTLAGSFTLPYVTLAGVCVVAAATVPLVVGGRPLVDTDAAVV